jgi:hypothetical protein
MAWLRAPHAVVIVAACARHVLRSVATWRQRAAAAPRALAVGPRHRRSHARDARVRDACARVRTVSQRTVGGPAAICALANDLAIGEVPEVLRVLTPAEQNCIALIRVRGTILVCAATSNQKMLHGHMTFFEAAPFAPSAPTPARLRR